MPYLLKPSRSCCSSTLGGRPPTNNFLRLTSLPPVYRKQHPTANNKTSLHVWAILRFRTVKCTQTHAHCYHQCPHYQLIYTCQQKAARLMIKTDCLTDQNFDQSELRQKVRCALLTKNIVLLRKTLTKNNKLSRILFTLSSDACQ